MQAKAQSEQNFAAEARATIRLAIPLILGQVANVAMVFVDTLFAGRLSALDLAAVAIGGTVWSSINFLVVGTLLAVPAFISQYDGAGQRQRMGVFVRQALWVGVALSGVVMAIARNAEPLLTWIGIEDDVVPLAGAYLDAISLGAPALAGFFLFRFVSEGLGLTRPGMYVGILGLLLNIPADYVFMYGKLGLPAMGAAGCGYATALVLCAQCVTLVVLFVRGKDYRFLNVFGRFDPPRLKRIREILVVGLPIGSAIFLESSMFLAATLLMGSLGTVAVAGHQIALNFSALAFMVPLGMSMAITVRVGNAAGRKDFALARFRGFTGLKVILGIQTVSAMIMLLFPEAIARIYTTNEEVIAVAVTLLFYAALFQFSDGLQVAAAGALRGIKDTRRPLVYMILAYWVAGIPLSYFLGIHIGKQGAGIWIGLIAGLSVAALTLNLRFGRLTLAWIRNPGTRNRTRGT